MTRKKLESPLIAQWLNELDAVIRHEVLHYLVEQKIIEADELFLDPLPFTAIDHALMHALSIQMDRLDEAEEDTELAELISTVGSLEGLNATQRFLDEYDFFLQVIEKTSFKELSTQAQNALTNKYPVAIRTVEFLMAQTGKNCLPSCLTSSKLNDSFSIENLWLDNPLEDILIFHSKIIQKPWNEKKIKQHKPKLVTSHKKYEFIDIQIEKNNDELRLISNYKLDKITKLNHDYQQQVLAYCDKLVKHHINQFISTDNPSESPFTPIPPPKKMLAPRYDGYLPYIIGLYCIKNMSKYKKVKNLEYNIEFDSFRCFVENQLFNQFDFLQNEFKHWYLDNKTQNYEDDLNDYISNVLTKRIHTHIKKTQCLINEYDSLYFSSESKNNI